MDNQTVSHSKYTMLRCLIALAHADGVLHEEEITYISAIMNRIPLSDEQRSQLEADFDTPQDLFTLLTEINEPTYRSQVAYFGRILTYKDGLHPKEEEILNKLEETLRSEVNIDEVRENVQREVNKVLIEHDISIAENRLKQGKHFLSWFYLLDRLLLKLGIDLLD